MAKELEVVEFLEPVYSHKSKREAARERKLFLRGNVSDIFNSVGQGVRDKEPRTKAESSGSEMNLKDTLREVQSLAASSLTGKTRRKFEEDQIRALGAKESKSEYVPYPHYQMVTKARRNKEKLLAEELKLSQKMKRRKKDGGVSKKGKGRWKDNTKDLKPAVGKFKNGVLTLNKKDLAKIRA